MRLGLHRAAPLTAAVALTIAAGAIGALAQSPGAVPPGSTAPATPTVGAPGTITLKDGSTFTLAQRIADKITNKEALNVYLSYQVLSQTGGPAMLSAGLAQAAKEMGDKYGVTVNAKLVGPPNTDPPAQSLTGPAAGRLRPGRLCRHRARHAGRLPKGHRHDDRGRGAGHDREYRQSCVEADGVFRCQ